MKFAGFKVQLTFQVRGKRDVIFHSANSTTTATRYSVDRIYSTCNHVKNHENSNFTDHQYRWKADLSGKYNTVPQKYSYLSSDIATSKCHIVLEEFVNSGKLSRYIRCRRAFKRPQLTIHIYRYFLNCPPFRKIIKGVTYSEKLIKCDRNKRRRRRLNSFPHILKPLAPKVSSLLINKSETLSVYMFVILSRPNG